MPRKSLRLRTSSARSRRGFRPSWHRAGLQLTCIFLLFMVVSMLITRIVARKNLKSAAERQETIGELTGIVEEFYNGRDVIKAYNHEHASIVRVKEASAKNAAASQM